MTPVLARVRAHVCGDGHLIKCMERDHDGELARSRQGYSRMRYGFGYSNNNADLRALFIRDVESVFGLRARDEAARCRVTVRSKQAWQVRSLWGQASRGRGEFLE